MRLSGGGITLVPSCKQLAAGQCTTVGADPGVFIVSSTGTGRIGTSCAGIVFDIAALNDALGTVNLASRPAGSHVTLSGTGSTCVIDFTFDVMKSPIGDQDPAAPGLQTAQATAHTQWVGAFGSGAISNSARATSDESTVLRAGPPSIATVASPNITFGGTLSDQATVTGLVNPAAGGAVTFKLYPPANETCTGSPVFTDVKMVAVFGTTATATSNAFTPPAGGVYRWVAGYGGDANNLPVTGTCGIATETRTVTAPIAHPTIATVASSTIALGSGALTDSVTVSGRVNPTTGAVIDVRLYGPDDATCSGAPAFQSSISSPVAEGAVSSPAFTPKLAGTYRWVVSYSGDANNAAVAGACNDVGESTVVSKATPKLATAASPTITLGSGVLTDAATVSGLVSPQASATIDFRLYGPRDPTCAAAPVFQSLGIRLPVSGGLVTTAAFTPTAAGTYRWVASYSGDANNAPMAGACNAPGETAVVAVTAAPTQLSHFKCYGARKAGFAPKSVLLRDQFMQTRSVVTKVTQIWNPVRKNGGKIVHSRAHLVCYATRDVGSAHFRPRSVRVTNQFGVRDLAVLAPVSLCVPSLKRKGTAPPRGKLLASALDHFRCYSVKPQQTPKVVKLADEFGVTSTKVIDVVRLCNPVRKNKGPAPARPKAHLVCSLQGRLRGQDCREPVRRLEARGVRNHPAPNCLDPRHLAHTGDELLRSELPVEEIPPDSGVQQVHGLLLVVGPADREDGDVRRQRPA